jgi:hypothetical protein
MNKLLIPFFILGTIAMILVMGNTGKPLKTATTPSGILHLEFAYDTVQVNKTLAAWKTNDHPDKIDAAVLNTYWDFLFIFFYAGLLYLSGKKLSGIYREGTGFEKAGKRIALLALVAGLLDIIENGCMLQSLNGNVQNWLAKTATVCASVKFTFLLIAVLYICISLPLSAYAKFRNR